MPPAHGLATMMACSGRFSIEDVLVNGSKVYIVTFRAGVVAAFDSQEDAQILADLLDRSIRAWPVVMTDRASSVPERERLLARARQALLDFGSSPRHTSAGFEMPTFGIDSNTLPDLPIGAFLVFSKHGGRVAAFASRGDASKCVVVLHKSIAVWCASVVTAEK